MIFSEMQSALSQTKSQPTTALSKEKALPEAPAKSPLLLLSTLSQDTSSLQRNPKSFNCVGWLLMYRWADLDIIAPLSQGSGSVLYFAIEAW